MWVNVCSKHRNASLSKPPHQDSITIHQSYRYLYVSLPSIRFGYLSMLLYFYCNFIYVHNPIHIDNVWSFFLSVSIKKYAKTTSMRQERNLLFVVCLLPCVLYFIAIITGLIYIRTQCKIRVDIVNPSIRTLSISYNAQKSMKIIFLKWNTLDSPTCRIAIASARSNRAVPRQFYGM